MNYRKKIVNVDVDGTLSKGTSWTPTQCLRAKPKPEAIRKVNKIARQGFVIIYTARRDFLIPATLEWLRRNRVSFQAISNNKTAGDLYVDNASLRIKDL